MEGFEEAFQDANKLSTINVFLFWKKHRLLYGWQLHTARGKHHQRSTRYLLWNTLEEEFAPNIYLSYACLGLTKCFKAMIKMKD